MKKAHVGRWVETEGRRTAKDEAQPLRSLDMQVSAIREQIRSGQAVKHGQTIVKG